MPQSKRMKQSLELVDREQAYGLRDAVEVLKNAPVAKFDESVDLAVNLGVDPKHADQMVRGGIVLPHGTGKTDAHSRFRQGRQGEGGAGGGCRPRRRRRSRQEHPGRVARVRSRDRDARHDGRRRPPRSRARPARPDAEPEARHRDDGRRLAPSRSRSRARSSTASRRPASSTCRSARSRSASDQLVDNATALIDALVRAKPASAKGTYLKKISISTTMGPGLRIDPSSVEVTKVA